MCFSADCQGNARNGSCVTTIVGYRGNLVYRIVASIPLWETCGRFPWEAPTVSLYSHFLSSMCKQETYQCLICYIETHTDDSQ
jgi:hypothetical protein